VPLASERSTTAILLQVAQSAQRAHLLALPAPWVRLRHVHHVDMAGGHGAKRG
jgi:hypothetical protein